MPRLHLAEYPRGAPFLSALPCPSSSGRKERHGQEAWALPLHTCVSMGRGPRSSEPDMPHWEGECCLPPPSRTNGEIERGNAQHSTQLTVQLSGPVQIPPPLGGLPSPQQLLSLLSLNPSPLLFIHNFGMRPILPCDISSVGCVF